MRYIGLVRCPVCTTPRQRSAAATRQAILVAARKHFLNESYENVGLRDIARDAGVDATLVNRYFGSKEELFKEVLSHGPEKKFDEAARGDLPDYLADAVVEHCREQDTDALERLLIILRSASSPQASRIVQANVEQELMEPLCALIGGPDRRLRANLAMSVMIGSTVMRSILGVTTEGECRSDVMRDRLADMFRVAIEGAPAATAPEPA